MHPSIQHLHLFARLLCLLSIACFLAGCETTEQMKAHKAAEADRGVNKDAGGELSPPLEAVNALGGFLNSGAGFHGNF